LFYRRGNFTKEAVVESAKFMQLLSITIFSIGVNAVVTRIFIAMQAIKQAFFYQLTLNIFLIAGIWFFTKEYGEYGYPCGVILVNCINYIGMFFICKKYFKEIDYGKLLKYSTKIMAVNLPLAASLYYVLFSVNLSSVYQLLIGLFIYSLMFFAMIRIKKLNFSETNK
jgi:peptidoglycan biosynthesis protein MviN/MurJ (putative lipid II flippase)